MFTILMAVYNGETASNLHEAFASLAKANSFELIDEVLLVVDGPISEPLMTVIKTFERPLRIRMESLPSNKGLAKALNYGLAFVRSSWVMRFDTDDVFMPERIVRQAEIVGSGKFDLFGSQIEEFFTCSTESVQQRTVPTSQEDIIRYSKRRNPFNHMTVCFRTKLARDLGGYPNLKFMEDYALWVLMMRRGARVANSPDPLVRARVGAGMFKRRGGWDYLRSEFSLQCFFVRAGHKTALEATLHGLARGAIFASPVALRRWVYVNLLRN